MKSTAKMTRYILATLLFLLILTTPAFVQGDTWETKTPMPTAMNGPASGVINGKLFLATGGANGHGVAALQEYDPTIDTWSERAPIPTPRPGGEGGAIGDKLYVVGGCPPNGGCGGAETNLLEVYDSVSDTWETKAPMPTPRSTVATGVIDGKLYVAGGIGPFLPFQPLTTLEVYDPVTNSWTTKAPMLLAAEGASAAVISGKLYVLSGNSGNSIVDPQVYDPVTDTWSTLAPMPIPSFGVAVGAINGQLHAVGGTRMATGVSTAIQQVYGPATNTWTTAASMPTARQGAAGAVIDGKLYVAGGNTNGVAQDVVEVYTPASANTCTPPPSGFVSWWPSEGDTNDIIGGNNGTWMGNPGFASGKVASAFSFGGSSYITMGTPSSLNITGNQVTIDGWINPSVNNNAIYFGKTVNGFNDYLLLFGFNGLIGIIKAGGTERVFETLFVPPVNQWTHIALTYDGANMKLYANGAMIGSLAKTGNIDGDASEFAIGGRALDFSGTHLFFIGEIDEVDVFNRALGDGEIAAIFNAGSAGKCKQATNQTPVAKCKSVMVSADASCRANASIDDGSFDPDAGDTISMQQSPPGPYPLGTTLVALTVTDSHGASSQCTATVTVVDNTPPTITCPSNIVVNNSNNPGQCSGVVNYNATATDNCSAVTVACSPSSGSVFPKGPTTVTCTATDSSGNTSSCSFTVTVIPPQLTALGPAPVWIGLRNSDDVGTKFDLLGEVFKNGTLVGSGELENVPDGSSGFNNALLRTINLALSAPVDIYSADTLSFRLSVRIASTSGHRAGTARLWFNDSAANSHFGATVGGAQQSYYLDNGFLLSLSPGSGPRNTIDVTVDRAVGGNPFKPFGTWGITF
jgi:N-acetylneuraminic acid mutarotase